MMGRTVLWPVGVLLAVGMQVSAAAPKITDIKTGSGKEYKVAVVGEGVAYYIDRGYTFGALPDIPDNVLKAKTIKGMQFIMTANDDKQSQGATFLTFTADQPVRLWVCRDSRGDPLKGGKAPQWLTDNFESTGIQVPSNGDGNMGFFVLYKGKKDAPAGKVSVGGNADAPAAGQASNYVLLVGAGESAILAVEPSGRLAVAWGTLKAAP
jgi:hypothetical protein